jgi:hypothetical protein
MTLPLPSLDDRTFEDLVDEARGLIRNVWPEWTNYNPSDPGITLIELFAWLAEMLIYRADQVPDRHRLVFLRLLNGPAWVPAPGASLEDETVATLRRLRARNRTVTAADYEALALSASPLVARARCVARRDLGAPDEAARLRPRPGYVSVLVLPVPGTSAADLEPRRLLTTANVIAEPVWAPVAARVLVAPRRDMPAQRARDSVAVALTRFLDPHVGGRDGCGWPFGRDVYVSDLYRLLEALPEVDYVPEISLSSDCPPGAERCAAAEPLFNEEGDQIGLGLAPHVLPRVAIDPAAVVVSASFVAVAVVLTLEPVGATFAAAARQAKAALRELLHPAQEGAARWEITRSTMRRSLSARLAGAARVVGVELGGDRQNVAVDELGEVTLSLRERELVDLQAQVLRA